jgi:hypothetical protein
MKIIKTRYLQQSTRYVLVLGLAGLFISLGYHFSSDGSASAIYPYIGGALLFTALACYHILFARSINKHIDAAVQAQQVWIKSRQVNDENYKRLQVFLGSIPELNKLLEAHLVHINESTEKASLAIISKLFALEERVSQILVDLEEHRAISHATKLSYESFVDIRHTIIDVLSHTQFQDISRQQIEVVTKGLVLCAQYSNELASTLDIDNLEPLTAPNLQDETLRALRESYTMESQRIVHFKATGDKSALEAKKTEEIELF